MHDQASKLRELVRSRREVEQVILPISPVRRGEVRRGGPLAPAHLPRIVAVSSGKGGVGKSNVAANVAYCIARAGRKTLLVDADLGLANLDLLLGLTPGRNLGHVISGEADLAAILMEGPGGLLFLPGASGLAKVADMDERQRSRLLDELLGLEESADLIIIDTGAGISQNVTAFVQAADELLLVTTPEPTAITDAYAMIKVLTRDGYAGRISVLVNQSADRNEGRAVFNRLAKTAGRFLGRSIFDAGSLPADPRLAAAVRSRQPVVAVQPSAPISRALVALSAKLAADGRAINRAHAPAGLFRRIAGIFF